jgi:two-component system, cell cycle sensor histidine kinase and response regulator CckA
MAATSRQPLKVLIVEDSHLDERLVLDQLEQDGFSVNWRRVQTEDAFLAALDPSLDVILCDFNMPTFSATRALELLDRDRVVTPLIVVSGSIGEDTAVQALHSGAADYLLKDRLSRLGQSIRRAIAERQLQIDKLRAEVALEEAEERTRFALQAARVGVWETDLRTGAARWSQTHEALHGLPAGTFGGTFNAFLDLVHADDRGDVVTALEEATRHRSESNVTYRTLWPDRSLHWITAVGKTFYDEQGLPVRAAGIGLDVTERHQLEEQYRQSQKVEAIGQLAGGIAHDFNNLLTAIQGYCDMLLHDVGPESSHHQDLTEIRRASERASSLTRQLLAFSRRQILDLRVLDLRDTVHGMESMLQRLIGEDVSVALSITNEPALVKADSGQIEQVILNLALNARDAMPTGGSLLIEVTNVALDEAYARRHIAVKAGPYVMLSVSDTGAGMDAETQARIFEPFFTTKPSGKGTGLGLSTVYGIVKQSKGNIWVYSEPNRGTTFKMYLPRVDDVVPDTAPLADSSKEGTLTGSETVLVVEDEPGVRELVRKVLERGGYRVIMAATPTEALEIVKTANDPIDLLMTDVVLPEMSGRVLAGQIALTRPTLRVLYMSGYTDNAIVHHGVLDPGTPFLQKPFTPQVLLRKVRSVLASL